MNSVERQAEVVDPIVLGTRYGPTRFIPLSLKISAASTTFIFEAPPEPIIKPERSFEIISSVNPDCLMASSRAIALYIAASAINRSILRSITSVVSISETEPWT